MGRVLGTAGAAARRRTGTGFTLIEVVVALGIVAIGVVGVLGWFAFTARTLIAAADTTAAGAVAGGVTSWVEAQPFADVAARLKSEAEMLADDARADYDVTRDDKLIFASRDGAVIGPSGDPAWGGDDRGKFWEIALVRNDRLSPAESDATGNILAFAVRLRWPAFLPGTGRTAVQVGKNVGGPGRFDHSQQEVLWLTGSILR